MSTFIWVFWIILVIGIFNNIEDNSLGYKWIGINPPNPKDRIENNSNSIIVVACSFSIINPNNPLNPDIKIIIEEICNIIIAYWYIE